MYIIKVNKLIVIFLQFLIVSSVFSLDKMPGEYLDAKNIDKMFKNIDFRGDRKNGNYEVYDVVSKKLEVDKVKFSIFDDKSKVLKWLEMSIKTYDKGDVSLKILTNRSLLKGDLKRVQIKYVKYAPFELNLSKNKKVKRNISASFIKNDKEKDEIMKEQKFIRNSTIKISGKVYKIKIYRVKNKDIDAEYAFLDEKDTKVFGLAYLKPKVGTALYLKELGSNSLSVFPRNVPVLDFINKISQMSEGFLKQEDLRKKALAKEKKLEKEDSVDKDDPIEKLNKMLEKEGK